MHKQYSYLALGDSYTIGEAVLLTSSFPYQTIQLLRKEGFNFSAPEIVAKTGWTTDELLDGMKNYIFLKQYDFITLLIGVNNQYRNRDAIQYKTHLENLLIKALKLCVKTGNIFILSIPDYSVTPFAQKMDSEKIRSEIEIFNSINKAIAIQYKVRYIDITEDSRLAQTDLQHVTDDHLHPSAKQYKLWADKLTSAIIQQLS